MNRFDKFLVYESKSGGKHVIGYYRTLPTTEEILIIIEKAHRYIKKHLGYKETAEYIQNTMYLYLYWYWYWPNIFGV